MSAVLQVDDLSAGYGGKPVFDGLSFTLAPGSLTFLLGANGVGKTSLMRCLLGLLPPLAGTVRIDGAALHGLSRREIARRVAHVPQAAPQAFSFSVLDLVLMGRTARLAPFASPSRHDLAAALAALDTLGIAHLSDRDITRLSGGQRQLALVARALAQDAPLVLMDEPTASLDLANTARVLDTARRLAGSGRAVLLSTHDPAQALGADAGVLAMGPGFVRFGRNEQVMTGQLLTKIYGLPLTIQRTVEGELVVVAAE